jgi:hypothetical protein
MKFDVTFFKRKQPFRLFERGKALNFYLILFGLFTIFSIKILTVEANAPRRKQLGELKSQSKYRYKIQYFQTIYKKNEYSKKNMSRLWD